jgi:hypothetical protein
LSQDVLVLAKTEKVLDIELEDIGVCSLEVVFHHLPPIVDVSQRNFVESPLEQAVCKVLAKILVFDCHRFGVNARSHQETVVIAKRAQSLVPSCCNWDGRSSTVRILLVSFCLLILLANLPNSSQMDIFARSLS